MCLTTCISTTVRNLGILRMCNTISRLRKFSDCAEHIHGELVGSALATEAENTSTVSRPSLLVIWTSTGEYNRKSIMYSLSGMLLSVNNGWILDFHGIVGKFFIFATFQSHSVNLL